MIIKEKQQKNEPERAKKSCMDVFLCDSHAAFVRLREKERGLGDGRCRAGADGNAGGR